MNMNMNMNMNTNMMPGQKRRKQKQYIPPELIEQILLKLPIRSLFRFSTVSKSWNSMIFGPEFAKNYRGREIVVVKPHVFPLSSILSNSDESTPFRLPLFNCDASCGELWCVEFENSLILHNPTTQRYRKLPIPSARVPIGSTVDDGSGSSTSVFVYGLGYDCVGDDYKILKIHRSLDVETELYFLKTDSWRKVKSPSKRGKCNWEFSILKCVFARGALHWPIRCIQNNNGQGLEGAAVLSFDLNTHKFSRSKPIKRIFDMDIGLSKQIRIVEMDMGFGFGGKLPLSLNLCTGMFTTRVEEKDILVNGCTNIYIESFVSPYPHKQ